MIEKLVWMKGRMFSTLLQNKKFIVEAVNSTCIDIKVLDTGKVRRISRKEFEEPWERLLADGAITRQQIFDFGSRNSAYIVAILASTPGVTHRIKPIQLEYKDPGK